MGEIRAKVHLENHDDRVLFKVGRIMEKEIRAKEIEAVVDTGAVMNLLPQDLVEALGLETIGRTVVTLANDQRIELNVAGHATLTVAGRSWLTDCLVGPPGCEILLGQLVMERLDLIVDPLRRTLTPRPESPYLPNLKLKSSARGRGVMPDAVAPIP
ncbi:MAG: aspartyl protease family protein [Elusimicrobia bacterium]|nr:aspartyl protease family protein [Elusimicrobiota bacterium]